MNSSDEQDAALNREFLILKALTVLVIALVVGGIVNAASVYHRQVQVDSIQARLTEVETDLNACHTKNQSSCATLAMEKGALLERLQSLGELPPDPSSDSFVK